MNIDFKNNGLIYVIVIGIGLAIIFLSVQFLLNAKNEKRENRFLAEADRIIQALEEAVKKDLRVLSLLSNDIYLNPNFERHDFKTFTDAHLPYNKSIQAIEWIPKVFHTDRNRLEHSDKKDGFPNFQFTEKDSQGNVLNRKKKDIYFPVYYVEPYVGNEQALGFDLGSNVKRLDALKRAANTGSPIATAPIQLVQGGAGILVFNPIYNKTKPGYEPPSFDRLKGFVLIVYNIQRLISLAVNPYLVEGLNIELIDQDESGEISLVTEYGLQSKANPHDLQFETDLNFSGRNWKLTLYTDEQFESNVSLLDVYLIVVLEILFVIIVLLFFRFLSSENKRVRLKVEERTHELSELNKTLQDLNKEMKHFTYIVSHDLQEPLRTMSNFMNLLTQRNSNYFDKKSELYTHYIVKATARMKDMINALLSLSQIGRDREMVSINCNSILRDVLDDLKLTISETNTRIDCSELPTIKGNAVEMRQLFQNLISNAIKFRKPGSQPHIQISAQKDIDCWIFSVQDNGIGIDEKHQGRIFQIFQRLHTREEYQGIGIGLANCKKIVELHGGKMWIESTLNVGSTFYFSISNGKEKSVEKKT